MSLRPSQRMDALQSETAFDVLAEVQRLQAAGRSVISFAIGEPDFPTPEHICAAAEEAIQAGKTGYSPSNGVLELRETVAAHAGALREIPLDPDQVVITPGAKPIIFHGILATVNPGDQVVYPNPGFPTYESVIRFAGAEPVPLLLEESEGFSFDPARLVRAVTDRTRLVILNSPHNPTGAMLRQEHLEAVARLAREHDFWVMSDEVYSRLVYTPPFRSIASLPGMLARSIVIDGFSKTYAMTGWRLGYGIMPRELAAQVGRLVNNSESCTATFTQYAGIAALTGTQEPTRRMVAAFRERRDRIVAGLRELPGVECVMPDGAFYAFANVTGLCRRLGIPDAETLQDRLLAEAGVAALARTAFGSRPPEERDEYLRFSYASAVKEIEEGLRRMAVFAAKNG